MIRFRWKLFIGFFLVSLVTAGITLGVVYWYVSGVPIRLTRNQLLAAVGNAVDQFDADKIRGLAAVLDGPGGEAERKEKLRRDPRFAELLGQLRTIDALPPHFSKGLMEARGHDKDIYLLVRQGDGPQARLLVTIKPEESGDPYDMSAFPAMLRGWERLSADDEVDTDRYGRSLSAYAPIKDAEGRTVAVLGMDAPAEAIDEFERRIWQASMLLFVIAVVAAIFPALYIAHRLNRPIHILSEGMEQVAQGKLDTRIEPLRTRDEFERLGQQFNKMVEGLREGEELRQALALAQHIQQHMLPKAAPRLAGFDIAAGCWFSEQTGGDFFDFIPIDGSAGKQLGVAVADVTGHGLPAALLMTSSRASLRSNVPQYHANLPALLRSVNRQMYADSDGSRFVTLFFGVIDVPARRLTWASAGHEPVIWYQQATGRTRSVDEAGVPLGIVEDPDFTTAGPIQLGPGDVLLLGTDGIREAQNARGDFFGLDRLQKTLIQFADSTALEIQQRILAAVREFCHPVEQMDDITLVVIKVSG